MWEQTANHGAKFRVSDWLLHVEKCDGRLYLHASHCHHRHVNGVLQLPGQHLPPIHESFVRGDELHLLMPQTETGDITVELVLLVVEADAKQLVLETVVSLHTDRLDLRPQVTLESDRGDRWSLQSLGMSNWYELDSHTAGKDSASKGTEANSHANRDAEPTGLNLAVLVDGRDHFSIDESLANQQHLGFFGDFLEKGVIRKVQPWWIWSIQPLTVADRKQLASELSQRPLPLTT